jgi:hypothetical protein
MSRLIRFSCCALTMLAELTVASRIKTRPRPTATRFPGPPDHCVTPKMMSAIPQRPTQERASCEGNSSRTSFGAPAHTALGAVAVIPWIPKRQKNRTQLPPTWTAQEVGKRTSIECFFGRVFSLFGLFRLQRPPLAGWLAVASRVALTYAATIIVALAAQQAGRPDLIRSPKRVLAHTWESVLA